MRVQLKLIGIGMNQDMNVGQGGLPPQSTSAAKRYYVLAVDDNEKCKYITLAFQKQTHLKNRFVGTGLLALSSALTKVQKCNKTKVQKHWAVH